MGFLFGFLDNFLFDVVGAAVGVEGMANEGVVGNSASELHTMELQRTERPLRFIWKR